MANTEQNDCKTIKKISGIILGILLVIGLTISQVKWAIIVLLLLSLCIFYYIEGQRVAKILKKDNKLEKAVRDKLSYSSSALIALPLILNFAVLLYAVPDTKEPFFKEAIGSIQIICVLISYFLMVQLIETFVLYTEHHKTLISGEKKKRKKKE